METNPNSKYFLEQEQIDKIIERAKKKPDSTQGYRVKGTDGESVTISSGTGGIGKGTGLYAIMPPLSSVLEDDVDDKYWIGQEHLDDIVEGTRNLSSGGGTDGPRAVSEVKFSKSKKGGPRVKPSEEAMFTLRTETPHGVALKAKEQNANSSGILPITRSKSQAYRVYSTEGTSATLAANGGGVGAKTGLYTVTAIPGGIMKARAVMNPNFSKKTCNGRTIKDEGDPSFALTCVDRHGVAVSPADNEKGIMRLDGVAYNVRRLTPRECFRLQGFPDELFEKAAAVCSDTQLYKQAGNAVTATVSYEIGKWIMEMEGENE